MSYREALIESRPQALRYAQSVRELPASIVGLRARISALALAPVKSLGMLSLEKAEVWADGFHTPGGEFGDRMAMVVRRQSGNSDGIPFSQVRFSQREDGILARVLPSLNTFGDQLAYSGHGMGDLFIDANELEPRAGRTENIRVTPNDVVPGVLENGWITQWLRNFLKFNKTSDRYDIRDLNVALPSVDFERAVLHRLSGGIAAQTLFSDGGQLLVVSKSSVKWMNEDMLRLHGQDFRNIATEAFRPNIVLEGLPPNAEDFVRKIVIEIGKCARDQVELVFGDPCVRCDVTRVELSTGRKPDREPLLWLTQNRPQRLGSTNQTTTFGINSVTAGPDLGKTIRVGDEVVVTAEKE